MANIILPPHSWPTYWALVVVEWLACLNDPESYAGGSIAVRRITHAGQVKSDKPDKKVPWSKEWRSFTGKIQPSRIMDVGSTGVKIVTMDTEISKFAKNRSQCPLLKYNIFHNSVKHCKFNYKQTIQRIITILMPIEPETLQVFFSYITNIQCVHLGSYGRHLTDN